MTFTSKECQNTCSIIIPTYNRSEYLAEAVESCLNQTVPCEVVIVDDGSTDSTEELIEYYKDRVLYLKKENGGPASAMNYGIERCSGDILMFGASDDIQLPNKVELSLQAIQRADIGYTGYYYCNTKGEVWEYIHATPTNRESIINGTCASGGALTFKRSLWEKIPYRNLPLNEDLAWVIDAYKLGCTFNYIDEPTYKYRVLPDGLSYSRKKEVDNLTKELLKEINGEFKKK
jgi:glycosyltransferase involved in cell wall biosynthesis